MADICQGTEHSQEQSPPIRSSASQENQWSKPGGSFIPLNKMTGIGIFVFYCIL